MMNKLVPCLLSSLVTVILFYSGCESPTEFKRDNKLDPPSPNYIEPTVTTVNVSNNQFFDTRNVTVSWTGNETADQFSYAFDGKSYGWTTSKSASFTNLDEGTYTISIKARNKAQYEGKQVTTRTFTVKLDAALVSSISMKDSTVIDSRIVSISWTGNRTAIDYQYTFDGKTYNAVLDTTVTFADLDEGLHTFVLKARNDRKEPGPETTKTFIVKLDAPVITSINITKGQIFNTRTVVVNWHGNRTALDYQYTLDDNKYDAIKDSTVTFNDLDEKEYTFIIVARNDRQEPGPEVTRTFMVNVVETGILFVPRIVTGDEDIQLTLDGVSHLMSAHIEMTAADNCAELTGFTVNNEAAGSGHFAVYTNSDDRYRLIIDIAFLGSSEGIGSVKIGKVSVANIRADGVISIDSKKTVFRSVKNEDIQLKGADSVTVTYTPWEGTGIAYVTVPGGSFSMGSSDGNSNEKPVHTVSLDSFEMSVYEITQGQYKAVVGTNPSYFTGNDNQPVEQVSWYDAVKFCNRLSDTAGLERCYNENTWVCDFSKNGFRLPTEAEWEYACRTGTTSKYYTGDSDSDLSRAGWYSSNSGSKTHPVGQKEANTLGLYDMHGNVYEWCYDWYGSYTSGSVINPAGSNTGTSRVIRGGSWYDSATYCRSTYRVSGSPDNRYYSVGLRVVRHP